MGKGEGGENGRDVAPNSIATLPPRLPLLTAQRGNWRVDRLD